MTELVKLDETSVEAFWQLRKQLFAELGEINSNADLSELESATKQYYLTHTGKDLISWGILCENEIVAIGSLCLFERIPYQQNFSGREGYILNIYTAPAFRNHGFASRILDAIKAYAKANHIRRLWLSSSENGKLLYSKQSFQPRENEMELFLTE